MNRVPYSHEAHAAACRAAAEQGENLRGRFVQYKFAGIGQCAKIRSAWVSGSGAQMWSLDFVGPQVRGNGSLPAVLVVACQGVDGRCVCADEVGSRPAMLPERLGPVAGSPL